MKYVLFVDYAYQFCIVNLNKRRNKMTYIIIRRDDWFGLEIVPDCYNKPKQFRTEDEAIAYINEMEENPSSAEVISVHI